MRKVWFIIIMILICCSEGLSQAGSTQESKILFNGIVRDASTLDPLMNSQIRINGNFITASDEEGTFALRVSVRDTVQFSLLGYQSASFCVSDTLSGREFMAGIYLKADTLSIGEVIIMPRLATLKSDILKAPPSASAEIENAKYNMAVSTYQGRMALSKLGDPASNYAILHQQQKIDAYEKGGIPSDRMVGLSPFMLIPAAYLLINGFPGKAPPMKSNLTRQELDQIHKKYLETMAGK